MAIILSMISFVVSAAAFVITLQANATVKEDKKEMELDKAVDTIKAYCKGQTEEGRCAFNLNKDNKVCDCALLRKPPEEWHGNEDEKERAK